MMRDNAGAAGAALVRSQTTAVKSEVCMAIARPAMQQQQYMEHDSLVVAKSLADTCTSTLTRSSQVVFRPAVGARLVAVLFPKSVCHEVGMPNVQHRFGASVLIISHQPTAAKPRLTLASTPPSIRSRCPQFRQPEADKHTRGRRRKRGKVTHPVAGASMLASRCAAIAAVVDVGSTAPTQRLPGQSCP